MKFEIFLEIEVLVELAMLSTKLPVLSLCGVSSTSTSELVKLDTNLRTLSIFSPFKIFRSRIILLLK
jgi:hypothetical protein